jgi:uncharacterized protein (TIGR03435 family)
MKHIAVAWLALVSLASAHTPGQLAFDVVSIRLNTSGARGGGGGPRPGGAYNLTNVPTRTLISIAYGIPGGRVLGGPGWLTTDRYDIVARGKDSPTGEEASQMLQAMLRDRFQLVAHVEQRDLPAYTLTLARPDGRLGPGMRRSAIDCRDPEARKKAYAAAAPNSRIVCGLQTSAGMFTGGGVRLADLIVILTSASGRPVLDKTGLSGDFDVDLKWTPTLAGDAAPPDVVSIFTAVQEQLGLKLESATAPLDVVVIDRIERPSEN